MPHDHIGVCGRPLGASDLLRIELSPPTAPCLACTRATAPISLLADAEPDPPLLGYLGLAVDHPPLDLGGATDRIHDAGKFRQEAVAGVLYDPAPVLRDLRHDQLSEMGLEALVRAFFVSSHQS